MTYGHNNSLKGDESVRELLKPLSTFLADDENTEICINRPGEVFVEARSKWTRHEVPGATYEAISSLGLATATYTKTSFSKDKPILSAQLPDGERLQLVMPTACEDGTISLTIRKPSMQVRRLADYSDGGFFDHIRPLSNDLAPDEFELMQLRQSQRYEEFLKRAVALEKVIVVAGATGSGKTTFMRALMQEVSTRQRVITIEDVHELFMPQHPNRVHLFYPAEGGPSAVVTPQSLLRSCLRMKPDRIFLAELRGGETFDFINVCSSGHAGSITSCHAGSTELTFERLALMILQNEKGQKLPYDVIKRLLYMVVDVVVHVHNDATGLHGRHITELWYDPWRKRGMSPPSQMGGG
ncbi:P-type DNA transfer ATPase VirB11 (plasmid) [Xanthomonas campestris pv. campestris]|uniref:P-type DNA transfer ATPase VirB11 n=1 Tax=Xanthomonas TaxID=338 RepID=UPI000CEEF98F|nr:P-type DNA transfer ATPase VirB11 [Xanthomonas arboricola]PPU05571.1 P-type DNA transfer ATPase VirB11 [Xanthomonas arboricola]WDJ74904.1 P-type DNA transfer ATPase VirB11 [Xanthomonas campestris pv. campestris]